MRNFEFSCWLRFFLSAEKISGEFLMNKWFYYCGNNIFISFLFVAEIQDILQKLRIFKHAKNKQLLSNPLNFSTKCIFFSFLNLLWKPPLVCWFRIYLLLFIDSIFGDCIFFNLDVLKFAEEHEDFSFFGVLLTQFFSSDAPPKEKFNLSPFSRFLFTLNSLVERLICLFFLGGVNSFFSKLFDIELFLHVWMGVFPKNFDKLIELVLLKFFLSFLLHFWYRNFLNI